MKKILGLCIFLLCTSGYANTTNSKNKNIENFCDDIKSYSQFFMSKRQDSEDITTLISVINNLKSAKEADKKFMKSLLYEAYDEPIWGSSEYKRRAINEFGNKQYLICIREMSK